MREFALIALIGIITACGDRSPSGVRPNNADALPGEVPCTEHECPAVPMTIAANPIYNGSLVGFIGTPNNWQFNGIAQGGSSRDIRMKAYNPPPSSDFRGQNSTNISTQFSPRNIGNSQRNIDVVIRDVSRCKIEAPPGYEQACDNLDQTGLEQYEERASIPWAVQEGNIEAFVDQTFTSTPPELRGANSGTSGCGRGLLNGFASGIGGGIFGAIIGGVTGCAGTVFQELGR